MSVDQASSESHHDNSCEKDRTKRRRAKHSTGSRSSVAQDEGQTGPWYRGTFAIGAIGSLVMFMAFPPLDFGPLAWFAPVIWAYLCTKTRLEGRWPYWKIYAAGILFWMLAVHWIRLPHWTSYFGWVAIGLYLGLYLPLFVAISRAGIHRARLPSIVVLPVVWTSLEYLRAYMITGFLMAALGHTQYRWITLIQISDVTGAYGVSFLVMFVAASFERMRPREDRPIAYWPLAPAAVLVTAALGYGYFRTAGDNTTGVPGPKIALIQGCIDTKFGLSRQQAIDNRDKMDAQYEQQTVAAVRAEPELDLIVLPESMYPNLVEDFDQDARKPAFFQGDDAAWSRVLKNTKPPHYLEMANKASKYRSSMLLGCNVRHYRADREHAYCSSVFVDYDRHTGKAETFRRRYDKTHPVIFGEYVPFGDMFPGLYDLVPLEGALTAGTRAEVFAIGRERQFRVAPSICFESVLPHTIRWQVNSLTERGEEPDVMITQTNDGWFWGSSELDMHMICSVFRAVECRKPFLTAANTGFSSWIDADGIIHAQGPRHAQGMIVADVQLDTRLSAYMRFGDWLPISCAVLSIGIGLFGLGSRARERRCARKSSGSAE